MPYLASPPEPPPTIVASPPQETRHSDSAAVSQLAPRQVADTSIQPQSISSASAPAAVTSIPVAATDFVKQAGESKAALLGTASTTGFLRYVGQPVEQRATVQQPVVPLVPNQVATPSLPNLIGVNGGASQASSRVSTPNSGKAPVPPTTVYSFTGMTSGLSSTGESDVILGLNQAIILNGLGEGLEASVKAFQAGKTTTSSPTPSASPRQSSPNSVLTGQVLTPPLPGETPTQPSPNRSPNQQLPPPIVPVPGGQRSPTEDEGGTVLSVPGRLPAVDNPLLPNSPPPDTNAATRSVELNSDRQEYDEQRQVFTAEGNVTMRYQGGLLDADRLQVNLNNRVAVAEGNVALTRGNQVLRGQRLEYNFIQGIGTIFNARGEIFLPGAGSDFGTAVADPLAPSPIGRPLSDRVTANQPTQNVSSPGAATVGIGFGRDVKRVPGALPTGGQLRRLRFEAQQIDFTPGGWVAKNIKITNDPFSPPQLILEADEATLTRLNPLQDELRAKYPRLVFDQRVTLPLPLSRTIIDRGERQPPLFQFGFDNEERGGVFIQRPFNLITTPKLRFTISPQIYIQRAIFDSDSLTDLDNFGAVAKLRYDFNPRATFRGYAALTSLDLGEYEANLRASARYRQVVGTHNLALEYSYRDRLFNGSLGFQTVQSSLGAIITSPIVPIGNTGIALRYQAGFQYVNADTDRLDLLDADRDNNRINLGRFQGAVTLTRGFYLWQGKPLPATPDAGLRYTPNPIFPYISMGVGLVGVTSAYTNGDSQNDLIGSVTLYGQFGHFSRPFFDYTAFSVGYYQVAGSGESPFLFDRTVDNRVLILAFTQQIYGPVRLTIQTSLNLDTREQISTDYILEISRRAYGFIIRYNPVLEIGSIGLRISDFNWTGGTEPFSGTSVTPVQFGVRPTVDD